MSVLIAILVLGALIWGIKNAIQQSKLRQDARNNFMATHRGWDIYMMSPGDGVIAFQHDTHNVVLGNTSSYKSYPWSAIASVDLLRDGASITNTNRGSQAMGAAAGGLLLGPLGLLIGGLSGSKRTTQTVKEISLKAIVDDPASPVYTAHFFRASGQGVPTSNKMLKDAAKRAEHVHALFVNAMRKCSTPSPAPTAQLPGPSVGDRISQLWQLREAGALTQSEYDEQKARLLAPSNGQPSRAL